MKNFLNKLFGNNTNANTQKISFVADNYNANVGVNADDLANDVFDTSAQAKISFVADGYQGYFGKGNARYNDQLKAQAQAERGFLASLLDDGDDDGLDFTGYGSQNRQAFGLFTRM